MSVRHSNKKRKNVARSRVSRLLQTVSRYISRDKYRDTSMNRDDTTSYNTLFLLPIIYSLDCQGAVRPFMCDERPSVY